MNFRPAGHPRRIFLWRRCRGGERFWPTNCASSWRKRWTALSPKGKRVIGICNGFQVLVKAGYLPGRCDHSQTVTLAANDSGQFQCHWVQLRREKSACRWLNETDAEWDLPDRARRREICRPGRQDAGGSGKQRPGGFPLQGDNPNGSANGDRRASATRAATSSG